MIKTLNTNIYNFSVGGKVFTSGAHIMGILNLTPDSFYPLSRASGNIVERAAKMMVDGAEIIDLGGQSTRPGSGMVSVFEEIDRVLPAVEEIKNAFPSAIISVDTFYPEVARLCLEAGADMINDVNGFVDVDLIKLVASSGCAVCIMHNRRDSGNIDLFADKTIGLSAALERASDAGIGKERILLDGGIGFNKNKQEDFALLNGYENLINYFSDYPFLLGTSRKSMFGGEVEKRLSATLESTELAVNKGVLFVRVHDVAENAAVINNVMNRRY